MALTDYEKYIKTEELLGLQKKNEDLTCHDEMQFHIIHQAAELWMKLVDFELRQFAKRLDGGQLELAVSSFERVDKIQRVLFQQMDLLDTMSPTSYMTVRTGLGNGSGQESPGFKRMLKIPGEIVWPAFARFLETKSLTLRKIYEAPEKNHRTYKLACLLYTSPSPRDATLSRMPSSA